MATEITTLEKIEPEVALGFATSRSFELMQRGAKLLASSTLVPKAFQGNLANCVVALNMAQRLGADPLMVMQNLYVVHGRPGWSSQFLIATINTSGQFSKLRYEWSAEKDKTKNEFGCRAWAIELSTGEKLFGPWATVGLARAEGWYDRKSREGDAASKWPTMTELMCTYRAAAFFVRTYAPEIAMGLRTVEEEIDTGTTEKNVTSSGEVIERVREAVDAAPSKLAAVVAADQAGKQEQIDAGKERAKSFFSDKKHREAAKSASPAQKPAPTYAEGSDPDPALEGNPFAREPGAEG